MTVEIRLAQPGDERLIQAAPVQRQLDAYNAHDVERFVGEYAANVALFRPPAGNPVLSGLQSFTAHYAI